MKKNKLLILIVFMILGLGISTYLFCQPTDEDSTTGTGGEGDERINFILDDEAKKTKDLLGENTSKALYKITVDTFEGAGEWYAKMPNDQGLIQSRRLLGAPLALKKQGATDTKVPPRPPKYRKDDGSYQKEYYVPYKDERKYILGVRVDFQKRGKNWFAIYPYRPIRLKGVVKAFEVWVCGRQKNHELYLLLDDAFGNEKIVKMGKLNFLGWKRMYVHVPDRIVQYDYRFSDQRGLTFKGFVVKCDPIESYGQYYIYFDNLVAEVSRFWEEYRDQKDPVDTW